MTSTPAATSRAVVIDVPGLAGVLLAHKALGEGADVLLMGGSVDAAHEAALKARALRAERLVMGPGAGVARLDGVALGVANAVTEGPIAVIGASGGAVREVAVLIDRAGGGVGPCISLGPRDLTADIGGSGLRAAVAHLGRAPGVGAVVAVLWPSDASVIGTAVDLVARADLPAVVVGAPSGTPLPDGVDAARTLEGAALAAVRHVGVHPVAPAPPRPRWVTAGHVRGLFSSGALCAEAAGILRGRLGDVAADPARPGATPPDPEAPGHLCLDLGDPVRRGALPHPAQDPRVRVDALRAAQRAPRVRVVVLDLVLGYGAHPDPAGALTGALGDLRRARPQVSVIAHVVGTERDPQGLAAQERRLVDAGVTVVPSNAAAARLAAAMVTA